MALAPTETLPPTEDVMATRRDLFPLKGASGAQVADVMATRRDLFPLKGAGTMPLDPSAPVRGVPGAGGVLGGPLGDPRVMPPLVGPVPERAPYAAIPGVSSPSPVSALPQPPAPLRTPTGLPYMAPEQFGAPLSLIHPTTGQPVAIGTPEYDDALNFQRMTTPTSRLGQSVETPAQAIDLVRRAVTQPGALGDAVGGAYDSTVTAALGGALRAGAALNDATPDTPGIAALSPAALIAAMATQTPRETPESQSARAVADELSREVAASQETPAGQLGGLLGTAVPAGVAMLATKGRSSGSPMIAGASALAQGAAMGTLTLSAAEQGMGEYRARKKELGQTADPREELAIGAGYAGAEFIFERLGIQATGKIISRAAGEVADAIVNRNVAGLGKVVLRVAEAGGVNATEEAATQVATNLMDAMYDPDQEATEGVQAAGMQGALQGVLLGGSGATVGGAGKAARSIMEVRARARDLAAAQQRRAAQSQARREAAGPQDDTTSAGTTIPSAGPGGIGQPPSQGTPPAPVGGANASDQSGVVTPGNTTEQAGSGGPTTTPPTPPTPSTPSTPSTPPTFKPPPPKVKPGAEWQPRPPVSAVAEGREGKLRLADGNDKPVRYAVVEAEDLITTHKPGEGFAPDPLGDANERAYEDATEGRASRDTVKRISRQLDPELLLTNTPTATDGPPITTEDFRVLGGNARSMAIKLAYGNNFPGAAKYREALAAQAAAFGIDPAQLATMKNPVLVRRIVGDAGARGEMSRILNESLTTGKSADTEAVSRGLLLEQEHTDKIASIIGEDSIREALSDGKRSAEIIRVMVEAGALSPSDLVQHRKADGGMEDSGKGIVERALLGAAVGDVRTLAQTSPATRGKLIRALPAITRLRRSAVASSGLDFQSTLGNALDMVHAYHESGSRSVEDLMSQTSMIPEPWRADPRGVALGTSLLKDSPTKFAAKLADVSSIAERVGGGQGGFDFGQPTDPGEAFDQVFGTATDELNPFERKPKDTAGQGGLFGQGRVDSGIGSQGEMFGGRGETAKIDPNARKPGESDADYRLRLRWTKDEVVEGTGKLFGDPKNNTSPEGTRVWSSKAGAPISANSELASDQSIDSNPPPVNPESDDSEQDAPSGPEGPVMGDAAIPAGPTVVGGATASGQARERAPRVPFGEQGRPISPPSVRTVVQDSRNTPAAVVSQIQEIRQARRAGVDASKGLTFRGIIADLSRALNMAPPGVGRSRIFRQALGFYRFLKQSIRNNRADNYRTHVHEIGHYLHELLFPEVRDEAQRPYGQISSVFPREWRKELVMLGRQLYGDQVPAGGYASEGWAETIRFLALDPARLKRQAPKVYEGVTRMLVNDHPDVWRALLRFRLQVKSMNESGDPIMRYLNRHDPGDKGMRARIDGFRTLFFDRFQRALTFKRDLGFDRMDAEKDPHVGLLRAEGMVSGHVKLIMEQGRWNVRDATAKKTGKSLREILEPVRDQLQEWQSYMVAKRAVEKRKQGFAGTLASVTDEQLAEAVAKGEAIPAFKTAAEEFQQLNEWLVREYAVHHGLITWDQAEKIIDKNLHYITFRYSPDPESMDALGGTGARSGRSFVSQGQAFKRFSAGKGEEILDPIGSFIANVEGLVRRAQLNSAALRFTNFWDQNVGGIGRWLNKVDQPIKATRIDPEQYRRKVLEDLGPTLEGLTEEQIEEIIGAIEQFAAPTFFSQSMEVDEATRTIRVMKNGKPQFFEVSDPRLFEMLKGLTQPAALDPWMAMLHLPARILRMGATQMNPSFFVPNFVRDTFSALVMTEADYKKMGEQASNRLRGMKESFLSGDVQRMFLASGADLSGMFGDYVDRKTGRVDLDRMFEAPSLMELVKEGDPKAIAAELYSLRLLQRVNDQFERVTRYGEFEAVRRGRTSRRGVLEAGQAAADITIDFRRGGTVGMELNKFIPFFNASLQGTDKLARFIRKDPVGALNRIFAITVVPSLISMAISIDDEEYWALPLSFRDRFFVFPWGRDESGARVWIKIPKPYGIGLFSTATERFVASQVGIDPLTGKRGDSRAWDGFAGSALGQFLPPVNVAGIMPLLELAANHSFFTGRPIVSRRDEDLPSEFQGRDRATDLAVVLGDAMGLSPAKIDYLVGAYTGGLGRDISQVASWMVGPSLLGNEPRPQSGSSGPATWPIVRSFMANSSRMDHEAIRRFYDDFSEARGIHIQQNRMKAHPERRRAYVERNRAALEHYERLKKPHAALTELWQARRNIMADTTRDPADVFEQMERIDQRAVEIVRRAFEE